MGNNLENVSRDVIVFQPEKSLSKCLQLFSKDAYDQAKSVLSKRMPEKILHLTELLKVEYF